MKNKFYSFILAFAAFGSVKAQYSQNFDSYTAGSFLTTVSPEWTCYLGSGSSYDALITNADAFSAPNSLLLTSTATEGNGPIYTFPQPVSDTIVTLSFKYKVTPTSFIGLVFTSSMAAPEDSLSFILLNSSGSFSGLNLLSFQYAFQDGPNPADEWVDFKLVSNLITKQWSFTINNTLVSSFAMNEIEGINTISIMCPNNSVGPTYVDDVNISLSGLGVNSLDGALANIDFNGPTLTGETVAPSVRLVNVGNDVINSATVDVVYNNQTISQNFTNLNLQPGEARWIDFTTGTYTCVEGNVLSVDATIMNVNGTIDDVTSNNSYSVTPNIVTAAAGKMVFAEEATGTWCGFCPRGAVGLKYMHENFGPYWAGVAVHNADPMVNTEYDAAMATLVSGYPTALVDRLPGINPGPAAFESDFKERIQIAPTALLVNGATFDPSSRLLRVSATATFQDAANSNYKMAIVLSENNVTGTTAAYNQANYFSGTNVDMGGFELLPDPVPAAQMVYNEVARIIEPNFDGASNCFPAVVNAGEVHTVNAAFILPADWDINEMEITSILIAPSGLIDNAGKATIAQALGNGYVEGTYIADNELSVTETNQPDATFAVYPNPSTSNATVVLQLKEGSEVALRLIDMSGKEIVQRNYGYMNGASTIDVMTQNLPAGTYTIELVLNNTVLQKKFVKM
jgi:hypothetical protein